MNTSTSSMRACGDEAVKRSMGPRWAVQLRSQPGVVGSQQQRVDWWIRSRVCVAYQRQKYVRHAKTAVIEDL